MEKHSPLHPVAGRKTPAQGVHIYLDRPSIFFLTVNCKDRVPWLNQLHVHATLTEIWKEEATAWRVGYYLLMPDHLHLFCAPREVDLGIENWITFWKRQYTRRYPDQKDRFQRKGFHHRLRSQSEYQEKLTYVRENPLRQGLVKEREAWPFQGTIHPLCW